MNERVRSPREQVTGVLADPDRAVAVAEALRAAGVEDAAVAFYGGEEIIATIDPDGRGHGPLGRLTRALEHFGQEGEEHHAAVDEVREGHLLVAVRVDDQAAKDRVAGVLREQGVTRLRYWGRWEIESIIS